ncbi:hypothetical protein FB451DRAFT_1178512 [Mycena latifolia]|nr:hypothetical protein FB451DRAFT_1178512 [Mycena latifolia]
MNTETLRLLGVVVVHSFRPVLFRALLAPLYMYFCSTSILPSPFVLMHCSLAADAKPAVCPALEATTITGCRVSTRAAAQPAETHPRVQQTQDANLATLPPRPRAAVDSGTHTDTDARGSADSHPVAQTPPQKDRSRERGEEDGAHPRDIVPVQRENLEGLPTTEDSGKRGGPRTADLRGQEIQRLQRRGIGAGASTVRYNWDKPKDSLEGLGNEGVGRILRARQVGTCKNIIEKVEEGNLETSTKPNRFEHHTSPKDRMGFTKRAK